MYALRLLNGARPAQQVRLVSFYPTLRESKPVTTAQKDKESSAATSPAPASDNPSVFGRRMVTPSNWDKKVLVWMKKYKSIEDIPDQITYEAFDHTQNRFRIRIANVMMALTIFGTIYAVWLGKKKADRGETLEQMNIDWHKQVKEDYQTELTKNATAKKQ